jgi:hypothetical protein
MRPAQRVAQAVRPFAQMCHLSSSESEAENQGGTLIAVPQLEV